MPLPLALAPIFKGALAILSKIPMWVWVALGAAVAVWFYGAHERSEGRKESDKHWKAVIEMKQAQHTAAINAKRMEIADWVLKGIADRDKLDAKLRAAERDYEARVAEQDQRRSHYVTPVAVARCDLTRGVVLAFNDGAAGANGEERGAGSAAPDPGAAIVDAASGVPLDHYTSAVAATQNALGSCRRQVIGWQEHWALVTGWYDGMRARLEAAP